MSIVLPAASDTDETPWRSSTEVAETAPPRAVTEACRSITAPPSDSVPPAARVIGAATVTSPPVAGVSVEPTCTDKPPSPKPSSRAAEKYAVLTSAAPSGAPGVRRAAMVSTVAPISTSVGNIEPAWSKSPSDSEPCCGTAACACR